MDVALCHPFVFPRRGGCERYIVDLGRSLLRTGHVVHVYASQWDTDALPGCHWQRVPMPAHCPRWRRPWVFSANCVAELRQRRHDVSVGFDKTWGQDLLYPLGGLHRANGAHNLLVPPTAWTRGVAWLRQTLDPAWWSFAHFERRQYLGRPPAVIAVGSRLVADHFVQHYGIDPHRLHVLPNAIDPHRLHASADARWRLRRHWDVADGTTVALFGAMNYALKGLEPLLQAVRLLPAQLPFRLVVAGNPVSGAYRRLAARLGIAQRVLFLGQRDDMAECLAAADCLVHPTFYDPCSLIVLEALRAGLPVVTTRYNGASELLHAPDEGLVIDDPHDHRQLAAALQALTDPATHARMSVAARRAAARWTWEDHCEQLLALLRIAAGRRRPSGSVLRRTGSARAA